MTIEATDSTFAQQQTALASLTMNVGTPPLAIVTPAIPSGGVGMPYAVKEIFYTLQGEGANAGRPAVFCRFAGCNLWSGREEDRARALACGYQDHYAKPVPPAKLVAAVWRAHASLQDIRDR